MYQNVIRPSHVLWNGNCGDDRKTGRKDGRSRVKNDKIDIGCYKKKQNKKRVYEMVGKNFKTRRQTSGHKVTLVWTPQEEKIMFR